VERLVKDGNYDSEMSGLSLEAEKGKDSLFTFLLFCNSIII